MTYPSPCEKCTRSSCNVGGSTGCDAWQIRYLYRQKQINAYARKVCQPKVVISAKFCCRHPDEERRYLQHSPCEGCKINKICNTPCAAYLQWWDARMEWVRRIYVKT